MSESVKYIILSALILFFPVNLFAQESSPDLDVPFITTPIEVVHEMLLIANVSAEDTLYDLGCGDGRIVITAAQNYGAFGVGVDLDPLRIKESVENAAKAEVADRTKFFVEDFFNTDISKASVVTLYVKEEMNIKLRPMLLSQMRPGARIVSHNYGMQEWEPDEMKEIESNFDTHKIYLWIVPADASGLWNCALQDDDEDQHFEMRLTQKFQKVRGSVTLDNSEKVLRNVKLKGNNLSFEFDQAIEGKNVPVHLEGNVNEDVLEGYATVQNTSGEIIKLLKAERTNLTK